MSWAYSCIVRCEVFRTVTTKYAGFWDVMPLGSCKSFGGTYLLHRQGGKNQQASNDDSN
jgi:hypothetical protein